MNLNLRLVLHILGIISILIGGTMLVGLAVALIYRETGTAEIFAVLMAALVAAGSLLRRCTRSARPIIKIREGVLVVALCWIFAAALGTLPYLISGAHTSFIDAFFEAMACLTTTGSTLLENVTELPHALLFWRQFNTWLGGMGILILAISIMPMLGYGAANLASAETSGQSVDKIRARMTDTAKSVYLLYFVFTAAEVLLLLAGGAGLFDAFILAFGCMGNGGFANYDVTAMLGGSLYIEMIIVVFCVLASFSFVSFQHLIKRRVRDFFKEVEIRLYLILLGVFIGLIFAVLLLTGTYDSPAEAIRYGIFQSVSFITTAGYAGVDFDVWPQITHWMLLIVMVIGGCSGSTSGGIKVVRAAVALSLVKRNIYKKLHPNAVVAVKIGDKTVPADRVSSIATFIILYIVIVMFSCVLLSLENLDAETTLGTVIAMLSNTGLVLGGGVGYQESFQVFAPASRLFMTVLMLVGRLEIFTILLLFIPAFWRPYR
ncbi:MAG: TrkH family potassium uptake protein [Clostridiales Family XIII bacterium]|jgi:trk system potassium uptake protein TrkH|nr:TrkH family potassium uptake protein [Clostridiales Family XIII bacterium]